MLIGELTVFARTRLNSLLEQWDRVLGNELVMQPSHGPGWERSEDRRRSIVTQARFLHNFAIGWRLTGEERWRKRARQARRGLREGFPLTPCGLPVFAVDESGQVINDNVCIYGVAFGLFGLAHGMSLDDDQAMAETAESWWQDLVALRDEHGGWPWAVTPEGKSNGSEYTHNVMMHLVEAVLAWLKLDDRWRPRAEELIAFCMGRLLNRERDAFPEYHNASWQISTKEGEGFYAIGHQWEWAHLLVQAHRAGLAGGDLSLARTLAATALRLGSPAPDHVIARVFFDGSVKSDNHAYWGYCEAARACLWLGLDAEAPEYLNLLPGFVHSLEERCYDAKNKGYATLGMRPARDQDKGQVWRVDYHQVALFADLLDHEQQLTPA